MHPHTHTRAQYNIRRRTGLGWLIEFIIAYDGGLETADYI